MKVVEIDRSKPLGEQPHTGHNRWHPDYRIRVTGGQAAQSWKEESRQLHDVSREFHYFDRSFVVRDASQRVNKFFPDIYTRIGLRNEL